MTTIRTIDLSTVSAAERRDAIEWNTLVETAQRKAGATLRWQRDSRDYGTLVIDAGGVVDVVYGRHEYEALLRYMAS